MVMTRPRIFSGMRPTGALHLGNLMGALVNWVRLQDSYDCVFGIVDWHSLTTDYADPTAVRRTSSRWPPTGWRPGSTRSARW
jgi:tryptophanyl-tRNA synthetase